MMAGIVASGRVTPPETVAADPHWSSVIALLHCNGTDVATVITDEKGHSFSSVGGAVTSTTYSRFGGSSLYFDGINDGVVSPSIADFGMGSDDFTIEFSIRLNADGLSGGSTVFDFRAYTGANPFTVYIANDGSGNRLGMYLGGSSSCEWASAYIPLNAFHDVAICRISGVVSCYLGGTKLTVTGGSSSQPGNFGSPSPIRIGMAIDGSNPISAYIDEIRITKGVGRYSAGYATAASEFPNF